MYPSLTSVAFVEIGEFAHEIVEPAHGGCQFAQREPRQRGRRRCPQQQRNMRQVAALGERADQIRHVRKPGKSASRISRANPLEKHRAGSSDQSSAQPVLGVRSSESRSTSGRAEWPAPSTRTLAR